MYDIRRRGGGFWQNVCEKGVAGVKIHQNGDTIFKQALLKNTECFFIPWFLYLPISIQIKTLTCGLVWRVADIGYFFKFFFRYYRIIFGDGTKDTKRGKFQVTGCLNVIMLSQDAPFFFWQPVYNVLPFLYKWNYWHAVFFCCLADIESFCLICHTW